MSIHYLGNQLPDGIVLQHTLYGEPDTNVNNAWAITSSMGPIQLAPDDGIPYYEDRVEELTPVNDDRSKRCKANDDTCNGWRIKDSEYCAGHARTLA